MQDCLFFWIAPNDRGYGHLAVCGSIRCRTTMKFMRAMNFLIALQPANAHRRVLPAGLGCKEFFFCFSFVSVSFHAKGFVVSAVVCLFVCLFVCSVKSSVM